MNCRLTAIIDSIRDLETPGYCKPLCSVVSVSEGCVHFSELETAPDGPTGRYAPTRPIL